MGGRNMMSAGWYHVFRTACMQPVDFTSSQQPLILVASNDHTRTP